MITQGTTPVTTIWLHQSTTRPNWMKDNTLKEQVDEIRDWHVHDRGWDDVAYHYLIGRDGDHAEGRLEGVVGAGVKGHNTGAIHICLIGGHGASKDDPFEQHFTPQQEEKARFLIDDIRSRSSGVDVKVRGHSEVANKACPGFNVKRWMEVPDTPVRTSVWESTTVQATFAGAGGVATTAATAVSSMDGTAQVIVVASMSVVALSLAWIFRERVKKWIRGIR